VHTTHTDNDELRRRARHLAELADTLERSAAMRLHDGFATYDHDYDHNGERGRLCDRLLASNLHQLHTAAEELRLVAFRLSSRAGPADARPNETDR